LNHFALQIAEFGKAQPVPVGKGNVILGGFCAGGLQNHRVSGH
jgi:hypothetical protein